MKNWKGKHRNYYCKSSLSKRLDKPYGNKKQPERRNSLEAYK